MTPERLRDLLRSIESGERSVDEGMQALRELPFADLGFATLDHHRELRRGVPEVIYGQGKTPDQLVTLFRAMDGEGQRVLATRVDAAAAAVLTDAIEGVVYEPVARVAWLSRRRVPVWGHGPVLVVAAGTSDLPVAEEACVTASILGNDVRRLYDVGVAGLHRLLSRAAALHEGGPIIVVAGMEGALPSVVAGLTRSPVIAVPTSVGYGAAFGGIAALLGMLNSCSSGVSVVNIDNGFGAAYAAAQINHLGLKSPSEGE